MSDEPSQPMLVQARYAGKQVDEWKEQAHLSRSAALPPVRGQRCLQLRVSPPELRKKLTVAAQSLGVARAHAAAAPTAAPAKLRMDVLEMNSAGMKASGY